MFHSVSVSRSVGIHLHIAIKAAAVAYPYNWVMFFKFFLLAHQLLLLRTTRYCSLWWKFFGNRAAAPISNWKRWEKRKGGGDCCVDTDHHREYRGNDIRHLFCRSTQAIGKSLSSYNSTVVSRQVGRYLWAQFCWAEPLIFGGLRCCCPDGTEPKPKMGVEWEKSGFQRKISEAGFLEVIDDGIVRWARIGVTEQHHFWIMFTRLQCCPNVYLALLNHRSDSNKWGGGKLKLSLTILHSN